MGSSSSETTKSAPLSQPIPGSSRREAPPGPITVSSLEIRHTHAHDRVQGADIVQLPPPYAPPQVPDASGNFVWQPPSYTCPQYHTFCNEHHEHRRPHGRGHAHDESECEYRNPVGVERVIRAVLGSLVAVMMLILIVYLLANPPWPHKKEHCTHLGEWLGC